MPATAAPPPLKKKVDVRVGPFVLMDELASGGMARVFRARYRPREEDRQDLGLDYGSVAVLKVMRNMADLSPDLVDAFQREAELLVLLDHPGIVRAITRGVTAGRVWIALEYVEGEDLGTVYDAFVRADLRMKPEVALTLVTDLCEGLAAAHALVDPRGRALGLVHRDISPKNVLLDIHGNARLVDFGSAYMSAREPPGEGVVGSPGYMSPEQARGEPPTQASDVYSLGLILFELLTGSRAYPVESLPDSVILETHGEGRRASWPEDVDVPARVKLIVDQALQMEPALRPPDAGALFHLLAPLVKDPAKARRALSVVARDLVLSNAERPPPLYVG